jgi:HD-like signal output (HDOD) protein/CheY-like chemotaxis protein
MPDNEVINLIMQAEDLPTLPVVASKVLGLTTGSETSVREVANLIEKDVALSTKILQVINSPFYGFSRGIISVSEAVSLMGFNQVGDLALGLSVMGVFPHNYTFGFKFEEFWEHSISHAVAAVMSAARVKSEVAHSIFTTALLQDIGTCLLAQYMPLMYGVAMGVARERKVHMVVAENEVMGTNHAEVGAILAERWNLPPDMRIPIRHHHFTELGDAPGSDVNNEELKAVVSLVNISNLMTDVLYAEDVETRRKTLGERTDAHLGLDWKGCDDILRVLPEEIERAKSLFGPDTVEVSELPDAPSPGDYLEKCPECGSQVGVKFCGDCGTSLSKRRPRVSPKKRTNKILVAEDSAATRTAISNMLKRMGYEVIIALNGEEAVEMALEEQPSLILMDIMMPVMDGITALQQIRSDVSLRTTPVVMLTSVTDIRLVTEAIECGANDYIAKPFSVTLLTERVERYVHAR